jgi:hypothetical protein
MPNRKATGQSFDSLTIFAVWQKAEVVPNYDSNDLRKDSCGAWIRKDCYGDTTSNYGWEIDHDIPLAKGGTDRLINLQPLHWRNNRHKSDDYPWTCLLTAAK